jgi:putative hydrolase of the HAD superfamily
MILHHPLPLEQLHTLLFDYGGTLDTDGCHWSHILREGFSAAGIAVPDDAFRAAYVHGERTLARQPLITPDDDFAALLHKKVEIEIDALTAADAWTATAAERRAAVDAVAAYCNDYVLRNLQQTRRVLDAVAGSGRRMVLVTNFYGNMHSVLRAYGLSDYFDAVVESAVVGVRKPDAAIYRLGLEAAGADAAATLVVGDSYAKDIVPATTLGCHAVWLHGRGWDANEALPEEPRMDATIDHLTELLPLLEL